MNLSSLSRWNNLNWTSTKTKNNAVELDTIRNLKNLNQNLMLTNNYKLLAEINNWSNILNISKLMKLPLDFSKMRNFDDSGFIFDKDRVTNKTFYGNGNFLSK